MTRPFFNKSIVDLEKMFLDGKAERSVLSTLAEELLVRETSRAQVLLKKVNFALGAVVATSMPRKLEANQFDLLEPKQSPVERPKPVSPRQVPDNISSQAFGNSDRQLGKMAADEAKRILACNQQTSWADLEAMRRQLVLLSHPDVLACELAVDRDKALESAKNANLAFLSLTVWRVE